MHAPPTLLANDGEAAPFSLTLRNRGQGRVYWVNVVQDPASSATAPIILFPPPTTVIVEPGATIELPCWVAAPARRVNPQGRDSTLALQITTAHGEPLHLSIPVQARAPSLQMVTALQTADAGTLEVAFRNDSAQDIASETVFQARLGTHALDAMTRQHIGAHEPFTLAFAIPAASLPLTRATPLSLTATKLAHPVRVWEFPNQPITLPRPAWYLYVTLVALVMGSGTGVYYLRLYRHPLVAQLSTTPQTLLDLAIEQLPQAHHLLHRTGRLATVLAVNALPPAWLDQAGQFLHSMDATARATCLAQRLHSTAAPLRQEPLPLFTMPMSPDFALNVDQCLLAFPPATMPAAEVLTHLQQMEDTRYHPCLLISTATLQQAELRQASHDPSTWLVTPSSRELTALLLSPAPLEVCARLIASQVQVRRISPYQTGGGVNKEGLFFGRTQLLADIMQRGPANYLLVGGRQMGKSSLLKALERRYQNDPQVRCHYLVLSGADVRSHLARALDLSFDTPLDTLAAYLRQPQAGQRWLFLLDEADAFVDADIRQGAPTLQLFRSLSEAGHCHFMLAGFWSLYHSATLDYQSPIRNFGTTLVIGALEADACRDLATQPMHLLNLHYADDTLVPTLVQATGQRANLIAIVCNEMGQQLSAQDRTISPAVLQQALDSQAVRRSLAGWERLTEDDEPGNRLDRIIVYSAINHDAFTLDELRTWFDAQQYAYAPEHLNEALARLELAYILARRGQAYHFCVPLFVTMVQAQNPPRLLADELRMERGRSQP